MERVAAPLRAMGAQIETSDGGRPPVAIGGGAQLHGIDYELPMASAQVKSALLLAALSAERHDDGPLAGPEPRPHRAHAREHGRAARAERPTARGTRVVAGRSRHAARRARCACRRISARPRSSSSPAASRARDGLLIENVGINPTRTGLLTILREMGAEIELRNERCVGAEPVADI